MKTVEELNEYLSEHGFEDTAFFVKPYFIEAIVGISEDGRLIYDYEKMIDALMNEEEEFDETDAIEWIDYNTIRAIPYMGPCAPVIMYPIEA